MRVCDRRNTLDIAVPRPENKVFLSLCQESLYVATQTGMRSATANGVTLCGSHSHDTAASPGLLVLACVFGRRQGYEG